MKHFVRSSTFALAAFIPACAPAVHAPNAATLPSAPESSWERAVADQAERLAERWPGATVRIAVLDVQSQSLVASAGPIDEPHLTGSTIKPSTVASAYAMGIDPEHEVSGAAVELTPQKIVRDAHPVHRMRAQDVLVRSSNVGTVRLVEEVGVREVYADVAQRVGLPDAADDDEHALIARLFGGDTRLSTRALGTAYVDLVRDSLAGPSSRASAAQDVIHALELAVDSDAGTGIKAAVPGVRVAGKTGTAQEPRDEEHTALFVGLAPVPKPRWVVAVVVEGVPLDEYGGSVAAPAFAKIVESGAPVLLSQ